MGTTSMATGSEFFGSFPCWTNMGSRRRWLSTRRSRTEGQKRNAEFIAHGLTRRQIIHIGMSEDEERQYIRTSIEAVEKATGKRPIGWSGPDFQETPNTPHLLAAEGIRYVCDWGNDEQPYKMAPKTGEIYSLGVNAYLDDNYIHLRGRRTINEVNLMWRDWFDGLYADGAA